MQVQFADELNSLSLRKPVILISRYIHLHTKCQLQQRFKHFFPPSFLPFIHSTFSPLFTYSLSVPNSASGCSLLEDPVNGHVSITGTDAGSTATYTCNDGYLLIGITTRVCQTDGTWTGQQPSCQSKWIGLYAWMFTKLYPSLCL